LSLKTELLRAMKLVCLEACRKRVDQGAVIVFATMNPESAFVRISRRVKVEAYLVKHYVVKIHGGLEVWSTNHNIGCRMRRVVSFTPQAGALFSVKELLLDIA
jgi:hypothetical protein